MFSKENQIFHLTVNQPLKNIGAKKHGVLSRNQHLFQKKQVLPNVTR